jgi:hypothetical protein
VNTEIITRVKLNVNFSEKKIFCRNRKFVLRVVHSLIFCSVFCNHRSETLGTKYVVSIEKYSFITIYGTEKVTNVTIVAVHNSLNNTYKLDFGETVSFSPVISGIHHVEGSGKIGIIYSNMDLAYMCDNTVNIVWEMIPGCHSPI